MKDKVTHGGSGLITREYVINDIDQYGDVIDVDHADNLREALKRAEQIQFENNGTMAVVVELVTRKYPMFLFVDPVIFKTVKTYGNLDALKEGGWL